MESSTALLPVFHFPLSSPLLPTLHPHGFNLHLDAQDLQISVSSSDFSPSLQDHLSENLYWKYLPGWPDAS